MWWKPIAEFSTEYRVISFSLSGGKIPPQPSKGALNFHLRISDGIDDVGDEISIVLTPKIIKQFVQGFNNIAYTDEGANNGFEVYKVCD